MSTYISSNKYAMKDINWDESSSESEKEEKLKQSKEEDLLNKFYKLSSNLLTKEEIIKIIRKCNYEDFKIEREILNQINDKKNPNLNSEWMEVRKGKPRNMKSSTSLKTQNIKSNNKYNQKPNSNPTSNKMSKNTFNTKSKNPYKRSTLSNNANANIEYTNKARKKQSTNNSNYLKINDNKDFDSDNENKKNYFNIWKKILLYEDEDDNQEKNNNSIEETNINSKIDEKEDNTDKEIEKINFDDDLNDEDTIVFKEKFFFRKWIQNTISSNANKDKDTTVKKEDENEEDNEEEKEENDENILTDRNIFDQILIRENGKLFFNNLRMICKCKGNDRNNRFDLKIERVNDFFINASYITLNREMLLKGMYSNNFIMGNNCLNNLANMNISNLNNSNINNMNSQMLYLIQPIQMPINSMNLCCYQQSNNNIKSNNDK